MDWVHEESALKRSQSVGERAFDGVEVGEDVIGEAVLAQYFPQVFGGVQLRAVRWQEDQPYVRGHDQLAG